MKQVLGSKNVVLLFFLVGVKHILKHIDLFAKYCNVYLMCSSGERYRKKILTVPINSLDVVLHAYYLNILNIFRQIILRGFPDVRLVGSLDSTCLMVYNLI